MEANHTDSFLDYCDKWDKALEAGIFKDAPKPPMPSSQTSDPDYFGFQQSNPTETINEVDARYWNNVYRVSTHQGMAPDPIAIIKEDENKALADVAKAAASSPNNPIRYDTIGKDQSMEPGPLGVTYTNEDLEKIADLKVKIHELEDKLNTFDGKGESSKKFEPQIASLRQTLDELSDALSKTNNSDK